MKTHTIGMMGLAVASALALLPGQASAAAFTQLVPASSRVAFQYEQLGVKLDGHFKTFTSDISFDPAAPEQGKASLDVELGSVDAGSPDADTEVVTRPWFNVEAFPKAHFESTSIKARGGDVFDIAGRLTIKGTTKDVSFPATFKADGDSGTFKGTLTIQRGDYAIGEGDWASFDIVANDVKIDFDLKVAVAK